MTEEPGDEQGPQRQVGRPDGNLVLDLFVLNQRIGELMEAALHGTGVRPAEYAVYSQLGISAMTPRELSDRLGVRASTLTGHLAALRRRGHTRTTSNPADGRSHRVELTPAGTTTLRECRARFRQLLAELDHELGGEVAGARDLLVRLDRAASDVEHRLRDRS